MQMHKHILVKEKLPMTVQTELTKYIKEHGNKTDSLEIQLKNAYEHLYGVSDNVKDFYIKIEPNDKIDNVGMSDAEAIRTLKELADYFDVMIKNKERYLDIEQAEKDLCAINIAINRLSDN